MWRDLRDELHPAGFELVTVALDAAGVDAVRPFVERKGPPGHPSLIDAGHVLDELLGVVNVPSGVWVDEAGMIVRPPEPAFPRRTSMDKPVPEGLPPVLVETLEEARKIKTDPERYVAALRDWVANGAESRFALSPDEVVARSRPRSMEAARAAVCFELGSALVASGRGDAAVRWFREAHALQRENWTYKRQAWSLADPFQGRTEQYESSWLDDVKKVGAENYYEPLDL